jgi:hypothetical protein
VVHGGVDHVERDCGCDRDRGSGALRQGGQGDGALATTAVRSGPIAWDRRVIWLEQTGCSLPPGAMHAMHNPGKANRFRKFAFASG